MLRNENIICISSIDWDFVWQGHQEIMSTFARNNNQILFIENTGIRVPNFKDIHRLKKRILNWLKGTKGFRKEMENLYVYSPVIIPFPYSKIARWINRHLLIRPIKNWIKVMKFHAPIVWTFLPTGTALDIIDNIDYKLLIYYCIADFYELASNYKNVKKMEDKLIKKSDLIFAQGKAIEDKCTRLNDNVHIYPFGVNMEVFKNSHNRSLNVPLELRDISRPIIGYIGGIHRHIDFRLLRFIAESHPEWSIVLIGPIQTSTDEIDSLKNIFLLRKKDFLELPYYINEFDVCIIPYNKSEYTDTVYPTKLNEYHALGKPVVSTDLPEIVNFNTENDNLVFISKDYKEFIDYIYIALKESDKKLFYKRISSAHKSNWQTRIEEMSNLIKEAIEKRSKISLDWREKLIRLYRESRKKLLRISFVLWVIYILVFYTPLVWFLASPLKVYQAPEKSDCIVIFAGGTGESGKAGQGYEERVKYAVELYKKGYADNLIFSSGYMYAFKEPLIMKALAISLGLPEDAIILEDKATNTYENIKFSKKILDTKKWNKILLVTSPYHTRRVSLVFNKLAKHIQVSYTPIPQSLFYSRQKIYSNGRIGWQQINIQQIKAIIHEYLGIAYYYFKGYL